MSLTSIEKDVDTLSMVVTCDFDRPVDAVWQLWADPRKLERWWGPPTYPATVVDHDLVPGGRVSYFMTGPEGDEHAGWWRVIAVDNPHSFEIEDGFSDEDGNPNDSMPTTMMHVSLEEQAEGGTRMVIASTFPSRGAMEQMLTMGLEEGLTAAIDQIDAILAG